MKVLNAEAPNVFAILYIDFSLDVYFWGFTCYWVQMFPYVSPLKIWLKGLSQGFRDGVQARKKVK